jgi:hypothetical protein
MKNQSIIEKLTLSIDRLEESTNRLNAYVEQEIERVKSATEARERLRANAEKLRQNQNLRADLGGDPLIQSVIEGVA